MDNDTPRKEGGPTIRDIFPTLTEQELREAVENFHRYCEIALQIHEEGHSTAGGRFDTSQNLSSMKERSNGFLTN